MGVCDEPIAAGAVFSARCVASRRMLWDSLIGGSKTMPPGRSREPLVRLLLQAEIKPHLLLQPAWSLGYLARQPRRRLRALSGLYFTGVQREVGVRILDA